MFLKLEELEEKIEKLDNFVNSVPTCMKDLNHNLVSHIVNVKDTVVQLNDKFDNELASTNRKIVEVADRYGDIDAKLEVFLMTQAFDSDDGDIKERLEGFLKNVDTLKGKTKKKKKKVKEKVKFDSEDLNHESG